MWLILQLSRSTCHANAQSRECRGLEQSSNVSIMLRTAPNMLKSPKEVQIHFHSAFYLLDLSNSAPWLASQSVKLTTGVGLLTDTQCN
jgi:hypothetical protein